jgi:hypothetical protein
MAKLNIPGRPLRSLLGRLLRLLRRTPPPSPHDPFAWKPAPGGSVAVAEPDED